MAPGAAEVKLSGIYPNAIPSLRREPAQFGVFTCVPRLEKSQARRLMVHSGLGYG